MSIEINKEELINYLASNLTAPLIRLDPGACPLARYFQSKYPNKNFRVGFCSVIVYNTDKTRIEERIALPEWAIEFRRQFDRLPGPELTSGLTALAILCPEYWEGE